MKHIFFFNIIVISLIINPLQAQNYNSDFWDGSAYFKVNGSIIPNLPEWNNTSEFDKFIDFPQFVKIIRDYDVTLIKKAFKTPSLCHIYRIEFNATEQVDKLIMDLKNIRGVEYAHKNPINQLFYTPNDVHVNQWYMNLIAAYEAWNVNTGNALVKVAIVDDAVKISHPDLTSIIYTNPSEISDNTDNDGNGFIDDINGWDVANNDNNPEPPASHWMYGLSDLIFTHGTHCSGIAGAATDNGVGVASIGFGISIIPVKCTKDNAAIPLALDNGPEGIDYAIMAGADIISLSWGSAQNVQAVFDVVKAALDTGIIVVAAAGNDGNTSYMYPASIDGVISVGAITQNDVIASFSQRNDKVSLMAPGEQIWSTVRKDNGYAYLDGTSMATPMVAGLAGLMKSFNTTNTASIIIDCLLNSCDNIDSINPSTIGLMGTGRINAHKAMLCLQNNQNIADKNSEMIIFYPNPTSGPLYIGFENKSNSKELLITDVTGRTIYRHELLNGYNNLNLDLSFASKGLYFLKITGGKDGFNLVNEKLLVY
ncbi:MAG: S8 family serine peptidase [Bacteroidales bacterium]|nr:S8 family serine peptidase [Bacteroidales bacterium]